MQRFQEIISKIFLYFIFHSKLLYILSYITNIYKTKNNIYKEGHHSFFMQKRVFNNIQIFTFHRVNNEYDPFFPGVPIDVFRKQMEYISVNFNVLSLEDTVERMKSRDIPNNALVITFDDGYRDVYLHAFPILKMLSIPATIFLATSVIDSNKILWHDRVFSAFRETQEPFLFEYGKGVRNYPLKTLTEKLFAQRETLQFLRSLDEAERLRWIPHLEEKLKVCTNRESCDLMLTWDQVRMMYENGISFGSHTVTHPILSRISISHARDEICTSKRIIEENLRCPIRTFSYPNGKEDDFSETTMALLKEAGYICALTTIFGSNEHNQDLFALRRGQPWEEDLPTFAIKLHWYKFAY